MTKYVPDRTLDDWARAHGALGCWGCANCHQMVHEEMGGCPVPCPNCGAFDTMFDLEPHSHGGPAYVYPNSGVPGRA